MQKEAAKEAAKEDIKEKAKETPKEAPKPEEMTKADIKQVNDKFSSKKLSAMEQLRLTNRLHKLASRLQITYHDLVSYLSRDGNSISERADYIEVKFSMKFDYSIECFGQWSYPGGSNSRRYVWVLVVFLFYILCFFD